MSSLDKQVLIIKYQRLLESFDEVYFNLAEHTNKKHLKWRMKIKIRRQTEYGLSIKERMRESLVECTCDLFVPKTFLEVAQENSWISWDKDACEQRPVCQHAGKRESQGSIQNGYFNERKIRRYFRVTRKGGEFTRLLINKSKASLN